jgi:hypothetical protein
MKRKGYFPEGQLYDVSALHWARGSPRWPWNNGVPWLRMSKLCHSGFDAVTPVSGTSKLFIRKESSLPGRKALARMAIYDVKAISESGNATCSTSRHSWTASPYP